MVGYIPVRVAGCNLLSGLNCVLALDTGTWGGGSRPQPSGLGWRRGKETQGSCLHPLRLVITLPALRGWGCSGVPGEWLGIWEHMCPPLPPPRPPAFPDQAERAS